MKKLAVLPLCIALVCCLTFATAATAASDEEAVLQVEKNFIKALTTGDYKLMSSLYWHSPDTITFAPGSPPFFHQGWDESLEQYWKSNLGTSSEPPAITSMNFYHPEVTMLKDDVAVINGYEYIVETDPATQEQTTARIRITRIVQKIGGKWLIVNDHASMLPAE